MKKALVVASDEAVLDITCRHIESLNLVDIVLFKAKDKESALNELSYGDFSFVVIDDETAGAKEIAAESKKINADLYIITAPGNKVNSKRMFLGSRLIECFEKPDYFDSLKSLLIAYYAMIYKN